MDNDTAFSMTIMAFESFESDLIKFEQLPHPSKFHPRLATKGLSKSFISILKYLAALYVY